MGILDMRKLWSRVGGCAEVAPSDEEVLAYVGAHPGSVAGSPLGKQLPTTAKTAPRCGDPVPDDDLAKNASQGLLGPGIATMKGSKPPAVQASSAKFGREDTLLIFDWDDTILCSTWLSINKLRLDKASEPTDAQREKLAEVARVAIATLSAAKELGTVVIITNAERGWIELTCNKFLPALLPVLEGIKLVSARSTFESQKITNPVDWKLLAFEEQIRSFYGAGVSRKDRPKNVLSFGDSIHEREALMRTTAAIPCCLSKSVKFLVKPSISQITQQHRLIHKSFERIVCHGGNLDLCLQCA